ncbi:MAG: hypothetical protein KatS3mg043_0503 [Rhodothermaceae bacterium]|nr:MAG: hypothetical protein KatS3mg043_0503 [Rhodothermaceae bacterium]
MPTLDRHTVLERLRSVLERHPVRFGLLYGSYAAGRPTPVSDIDVAVYADRPEELLDVVVALEEAFSGHRVDVMNLKDKPALVYYEVLASGVSVLVRDPSFLEAETYRVMREYPDFQPIHERILADMARRIETGTYGKPAIPPPRTGGESGGTGTAAPDDVR